MTGCRCAGCIPKSESDYNLEHQNEALERQFGGVDDVNKLMWILQ